MIRLMSCLLFEEILQQRLYVFHFMLFVIEDHVVSLFIIYYTSPVAGVLFDMGDNCVGE